MSEMNLFNMLERGLAMLSVIIPRNITEIISAIHNYVLEIEHDNQILQEELELIYRENLQLRSEKREMEEAIMAHIERDIQHMKSLVKQVNHTSVVEQLD
jgi:hypothetical protein